MGLVWNLRKAFSENLPGACDRIPEAVKARIQRQISDGFHDGSIDLAVQIASGIHRLNHTANFRRMNLRAGAGQVLRRVFEGVHRLQRAAQVKVVPLDLLIHAGKKRGTECVCHFFIPRCGSISFHEVQTRFDLQRKGVARPISCGNVYARPHMIRHVVLPVPIGHQRGNQDAVYTNLAFAAQMENQHRMLRRKAPGDCHARAKQARPIRANAPHVSYGNGPPGLQLLIFQRLHIAQHARLPRWNCGHILINLAQQHSEFVVKNLPTSLASSDVFQSSFPFPCSRQVSDAPLRCARHAENPALTSRPDHFGRIRRIKAQPLIERAISGILPAVALDPRRLGFDA